MKVIVRVLFIWYAEEEVIADCSDGTFAALQQKHPAPHHGSVIEHDAELVYKGELSELDVTYAVKSFPC